MAIFDQGGYPYNAIAFATEALGAAHDESRALAGDSAFQRFGLADAAIATVCSRGILVLTTDLQPQLALQERNIGALNFNHIRPLSW